MPALAMMAGPGPADGQRHRLVPVLVTAQLLPVAGGQQQRVVGPGPEHQHVQDARALRVDGQPGVRGEQVDQCLRADQGDARGDDREEPQHRAAVGDEQQHDHHRQGGDEQDAVDALERVGRVSGAAQRAGDVDRQPGRPGPGDVPQAGRGGRRLVPARRAEVDRDQGLDGFPVLGHDRPRHLRGDHPGHLGEPRAVGGHLGPVGAGQAGRPVVDHDGGEHVGGLDLRLEVHHLGGLGLGRQPGRRVVLLGARQLAGQRAGQRDDDQPEDHDGPLGPASARQGQDGTSSAHGEPPLGHWSGA